MAREKVMAGKSVSSFFMPASSCFDLNVQAKTQQFAINCQKKEDKETTQHSARK